MAGSEGRASTAQQREDRRLDRSLGGRPPEVPVFAQPGERGPDGPPLLEQLEDPRVDVARASSVVTERATVAIAGSRRVCGA
ncbi:UNVERIFIED_CONTAM: hypothetical protein RKD50_008264 [Streptomyces canus]|jgi:hypothetical protein